MLRNEHGVVLAAILVLLVVLTLSAFGAALLTRTDIQLVNNGYAERKAFYTAEAGVAEATLRLALPGTQNATVDGNTFDASFTGAYTPDWTQPSWQAQIRLSGTATSKSSNTVTTPTLQPSANRLAYSTTDGSSGTLTIGWELSSGAIRTINGKSVLDIISTGQSGAARRRIVKRVSFNRLSSAVLDSSACPGVNANGTVAVTFDSAVQVNSTCSTAVKTSGSATITAGGAISITSPGSSSGTGISPTPTTVHQTFPDPLQLLSAPSLANYTTQRNAQLTVSGNSTTQTISPGVYYGGIQVKSGAVLKMNKGVYIMAGGGFSVASNGTVTSCAGTVSGSGCSVAEGVMIYNTGSHSSCAISDFSSSDAISISAGNNTTALRLEAPNPTSTSDSLYSYRGIVVFQDRNNSQPISFSGSGSGIVDGLIYAKTAQVSLGGGSNLLHSQLVVGSISVGGNSTIQAPTLWVPIGGAGIGVMSWQDFSPP